MELLVHGSPPTAIPAIITSVAAYLIPFREAHVPGVNFCRRMRSELRVVTETLAALRVSQSGQWRQLFTDGTSRRQTALLTVIIAIDGEDGVLLPIIMRAAFIASGETSVETVKVPACVTPACVSPPLSLPSMSHPQVDDILERVIKRGAAKLSLLRVIFEELYPGVSHSIPAASELSIAKLSRGAITSDNCNGALKVKRLMVEQVQTAVKAEFTDAEWSALSSEQQTSRLLVLEVDCWNHLRNVWLGAMTGALSKRLTD